MALQRIGYLSDFPYITGSLRSASLTQSGPIAELGVRRCYTLLHMSLNKTQNLLSRRFSGEAQVIEGWMRGTYIVAGIFAILVEAVTIAELQANIPRLYATTKKAKQGRWPRGICGTFVFPFYLGTQFDPAAIAWVQRCRPYRWAIWHEPVLYDISQNAVWMRSDYGRFGSAFYPLVFEMYRRALTLIAERLQKPIPDFINGISTKTGNA